MTEATHFIDEESLAVIEDVGQLIQNLRDGQFIYIRKSIGKGGFQERRYKIREIRTVIDHHDDAIVQNVVVN
jgi:hypothetical protein